MCRDEMEVSQTLAHVDNVLKSAVTKSAVTPAHWPLHRAIISRRGSNTTTSPHARHVTHTPNKLTTTRLAPNTSLATPKMATTQLNKT